MLRSLTTKCFFTRQVCFGVEKSTLNASNNSFVFQTWRSRSSRNQTPGRRSPRRKASWRIRVTGVLGGNIVATAPVRAGGSRSPWTPRTTTTTPSTGTGPSTATTSTTRPRVAQSSGRRTLQRPMNGHAPAGGTGPSQLSILQSYQVNEFTNSEKRGKKIFFVWN